VVRLRCGRPSRTGDPRARCATRTGPGIHCPVHSVQLRTADARQRTRSVKDNVDPDDLVAGDGGAITDDGRPSRVITAPIVPLTRAGRSSPPGGAGLLGHRPQPRAMLLEALGQPLYP
jgi:hypothetical protein